MDKFSKDEQDYIDLFHEDFGSYLTKTSIPASILIRRIIDRDEPLNGQNAMKQRFKENYKKLLSEISDFILEPQSV